MKSRLHHQLHHLHHGARPTSPSYRAGAQGFNAARPKNLPFHCHESVVLIRRSTVGTDGGFTTKDRPKSSVVVVQGAGGWELISIGALDKGGQISVARRSARRLSNIRIEIGIGGGDGRSGGRRPMSVISSGASAGSSGAGAREMSGGADAGDGVNAKKLL